MDIKYVEIRDHATCIPAVAFRMKPSDPIAKAFMERCGYPLDGHGVILMELWHQRATSDPYFWNDRTYLTAHNHIIDKWDNIEDGAVVDVRVILGERNTTASPEVYYGA